MTIQVNAQTRDGVWGYMITTWKGATLVAASWFAVLPALPSEALNG